MNIRAIEKKDLGQIVQERNNAMGSLRTSYRLNNEMQEKYFNDVICNRQGLTRYWMFAENEKSIGYGGIENIEWDNRRGEISILVFKNFIGLGYGKKCVEKILRQAFSYMNLRFVWGLCYETGNWRFWIKIIKQYRAFFVWLPNQKYYKGQYYKGLYFQFKKEDFTRKQIK